MKQKISAIIIGLLFATNALAVEIIPLPEFTAQESFIQKIWRCKFSIACYREPRLGVSVTEISGSTLISAYPTIQNTNVNNLNNGKIENSSSSVAAITTLSNLVTVGTLTSGSLGSGFTTVNVAQGGTGSSTLSANQVLLGNGTGNIGVVSGWGSSGQMLSSNGGALAPTWQSVTTDQTANYIWSGTHTFNNRAVFGSSINATGTTLIQNLNASSTAANPIVLNGVSYNTPSTQGAATTTLTNNGSGVLTWEKPSWTLIASSTSIAGDQYLVSTTTSPHSVLRAVLNVKQAACNGLLVMSTDTRIAARSSATYSINNGAYTTSLLDIDPYISSNSGAPPKTLTVDIMNFPTSSTTVFSRMIESGGQAADEITETWITFANTAQATVFKFRQEPCAYGVGSTLNLFASPE